MSFIISVPATIEQHRSAIAQMRADGYSQREIAARVGIKAGSLAVYIHNWRASGDDRFAHMSTAERYARARTRLPMCRWPQWRQAAAFLNAGYTLAEAAPLMGVKRKSLMEQCCRWRRSGYPVPGGIGQHLPYSQYERRAA